MSLSCITCPAGKYCPDLATPDPTDTANGFTTANLKARHEEAIDCPAGKYCPAGSYAPIDCAIGYYNPFLGA